MAWVQSFKERRVSSLLGYLEASKKCPTSCFWADPNPVPILGIQACLWSPGELSERWHQGSGLWCLSNFCSWTAPYVKTLVRNSRPVSHSTCQGSSDHVILGFQPHAASLRGKNPQITAIALIDKYPFFQSLIAKYILSSNPYSSLEVSR